MPPGSVGSVVRAPTVKANIEASIISRYIVSAQTVREDEMSPRYLCCLCSGFFLLFKAEKQLNNRPTQTNRDDLIGKISERGGLKCLPTVQRP